MGKEEILQLKKEVIVLADYPEIYDDELSNRLISLKETMEREYNRLTKEDKSWVDFNFNEWLEFYLGNSCFNECSGCACNDYE